MLRIALIGTEVETPPLMTSAARLPDIECVCAALDSTLEGFDAVAFLGAHEGGVQAICDVAANAKHLLVDLAALNTAAEAEAVIAACRTAAVQLMFGRPRRFLPSVQAVRESLDAGELGKPGLLRIHRWVAHQGAGLASLLIHEIDLANYLFDHPPATVYAVASDRDDSRRFVQVHLGFDGGAMALIDIATSLPEGDDYYSLSLIGADGSAYADDHHNMQLLYSGGPAAAHPTQQNALNWTEPLSEFAAAIKRPHEPAIGGDSALAGLRVTAAVQRAIESRSAMHWQGDTYEPA